MSDIIVVERTPLVIAAEINMIKYQTEKIVITNAIEIGRRLTEAKALLKHGEWGKWLEESVSYSQSTADKLMQIFREYGPKLLASPGGDGSLNSETFPNLTYSQALILLGFPAEEREQFITDNDVENMAARELRQAVKGKNQALQDKDPDLQDKDQTIQDLQTDLDGKNSEISQLTNKIQSLENEVSEYKQKYEGEQDNVTQKQRELDEAIEEIPSARRIAELEDEAKTSETNALVMKYEAQFAIHRENIRSAYEEMLKTLTALARTDPEKKEINRKAAHELLQNLTKMLEVWPPAIVQ